MDRALGYPFVAASGVHLGSVFHPILDVIYDNDIQKLKYSRTALFEEYLEHWTNVRNASDCTVLQI